MAVTFTPHSEEQHLVVCSECGAVVLGEMEFEHTEWHVRNGDPVDLSHLGGANDPGPMPPKE